MSPASRLGIGDAPIVSGVQVRRAREDDVDTLLAIQREAAVDAFGHIYSQDRYPFPSDQIRADWMSAVADLDNEIYLAECDGAAIASVSVGADYLRTLYVLPAHQGRGIGSALHDFALERLRSRGVSRAKLWTLEENHAGRGFYERRGWTLTEETRIVPFPPNPIDVQYAKELRRAPTRPE